jgi:hypothetical protein
VSEGQGFQFTPFGIIPLGETPPNVGDDVVPGTARVTRPEPTRDVAAARQDFPPVPPVTAAAISRGTPLKGRDLVAAARARVREITKALRAVPALEAERASLKRLIDAAAPRKRATVVALKQKA